MKVEAENVELSLVGIFNVVWPSPNGHRMDPGDGAPVYVVFLAGNGGNGGHEKGLHLHHVVIWVQLVPQGLSAEYQGLFLLKVGYIKETSH